MPESLQSKQVSLVTSAATGILLSALTLAIPSRSAEIDLSQLPPPAQGPVQFERDIKPIFENVCFRCHGTERPKSHFSLATRETALKGGSNGIDILPGDSAHSPLIHYVARLVEDMEMPPEGRGEPLTPTPSLAVARLDRPGRVLGKYRASGSFGFFYYPNGPMVHCRR